MTFSRNKQKIKCYKKKLAWIKKNIIKDCKKKVLANII
jgi:hypothetical protein